MRAKIGTARADDLPSNWCTAAQTGFSFPSIDCKAILKGAFFAISLSKIPDSGSLTADSFVKNRRNGEKKVPFFGTGEGQKFPFRVDATPKEDFAGVDIADTGNFVLVEEEILDTPFSRKERTDTFKSIGRGEGVNSKSGEKIFLLLSG